MPQRAPHAPPPIGSEAGAEPLWGGAGAGEGSLLPGRHAFRQRRMEEGGSTERQWASGNESERQAGWVMPWGGVRPHREEDTSRRATHVKRAVFRTRPEESSGEQAVLNALQTRGAERSEINAGEGGQTGRAAVSIPISTGRSPESQQKCDLQRQQRMGPLNVPKVAERFRNGCSTGYWRLVRGFGSHAGGATTVGDQ